MSFGRRACGRGVFPTTTVVATAVSCLALSACGQPGGTPSQAGGPVDSGVAAFTPSATPTVVADGAYGKPSTGGVRLAPTGSGLLDGKVIAIDPGHSGKYDTAMLYRTMVDYYRAGRRPCQSAGSTALDKKTTESFLNWDIASRAVTILRSRGATVLLTRPDNEGYGPCNDERAQIANRAKANLLISIHADGNSNAANRGFYVISSKEMKGGSAIAAQSAKAAETLVAAVKSRSKIPVANNISTGDGTLEESNSLGVLNTMETGPAVLIEMGNIVQKPDWEILSTESGRQAFAEGVAEGAGSIVLTPASAASTASAAPTKTK